ncbi:hypothetical protein DFH29DRAFT_190689 [Suillus ampliporus]|nr:hypothetical protein DFH29DRAFT_190689 [Suillus ampliporus]
MSLLVSMWVHMTEHGGGRSFGGAVANSLRVSDHLLVMLHKETSWANSGRTEPRGVRFGIPQLGEWVHSWDTPREEDLIQNFMSAPVSKELDVILRPHIASLQRLLDSPNLNQDEAERYHIMDFIIRSKKKPDGVGAYSIPFCGDISSREYAKIARWFSDNIPGAPSQVQNGLVACLWCMLSRLLSLIERLAN